MYEDQKPHWTLFVLGLKRETHIFLWILNFSAHILTGWYGRKGNLLSSLYFSKSYPGVLFIVSHSETVIYIDVVPSNESQLSGSYIFLNTNCFYKRNICERYYIVLLHTKWFVVVCLWLWIITHSVCVYMMSMKPFEKGEKDDF